MFRLDTRFLLSLIFVLHFCSQLLLVQVELKLQQSLNSPLRQYSIRVAALCSPSRKGGAKFVLPNFSSTFWRAQPGQHRWRRAWRGSRWVSTSRRVRTHPDRFLLSVLSQVPGLFVMSSERYSDKIWNRRSKWDSFRRNSAQVELRDSICICTTKQYCAVIKYISRLYMIFFYLYDRTIYYYTH